ncbi:sec-independent translocase [Nocardioides coralli]|uniref:sec-independent translocase n=1 Tax=Nocardioides coralli TaxID=2872154 RepID=UPI001CA39332|nr:sec-independent translocase [Nocardioides coralli]QZY30034.1 Sec-independent protein translocase subunit TatB [Nocardioides coralli]
MFGVGLPEMAIIALVAVMVFGPDKLPEFAREAGRFLHRLKVFATGARDELRAELGPDFKDLELRDLDPRSIVRKHIVEAMEEAEAEEAASRRKKARGLLDGEVPPYDVEAT